jgi:hypothetical protein
VGQHQGTDLSQLRQQITDPGNVPPDAGSAIRRLVANSVALGYAWPRTAPPVRAIAWAIAVVLIAILWFLAHLLGLPIQPALKSMVTAGRTELGRFVRR